MLFMDLPWRCGVRAALMCAVKPEGVPQLCKADEIGELCVCTVATGAAYYGLTGMTKNTFEVRRLRVHLRVYEQLP